MALTVADVDFVDQVPAVESEGHEVVGGFCLGLVPWIQPREASRELAVPQGGRAKRVAELAAAELIARWSHNGHGEGRDIMKDFLAQGQVQDVV